MLDTDDEAVLQVMNEPKYDGMLVEDGGNVHVTSAHTWYEYEEFSTRAVAAANKSYVEHGRRDFICLDFVSSAWPKVQNNYLLERARAAGEEEKSRGEMLWDQGVAGKEGWAMFEGKINWNSVNGKYFDAFITPILVESGAHVFMTAMQEVIEAARPTDEQAEHLAQFGKYKAVGQKLLPHQCRSYLRKQRLARGRCLFTNGKDRARPEFNGETCSDFFQVYMKAAGWEVE